MSKKIMGAVVGLPSPRSDWNQTDENKADYIKNKPEIVPVEVFSDVYFNRLPAVEANKADKSYVDEKVAAVDKKVDEIDIPATEQLRQDLGIAGIETLLSELYFNRVPALEENKADKDFIEEQLGDIETALDGIIAIQNELMGVSE